jgi:hypothetical protein
MKEAGMDALVQNLGYAVPNVRLAGRPDDVRIGRGTARNRARPHSDGE